MARSPSSNSSSSSNINTKRKSGQLLTFLCVFPPPRPPLPTWSACALPLAHPCVTSAGCSCRHDRPGAPHNTNTRAPNGRSLLRAAAAPRAQGQAQSQRWQRVGQCQVSLCGVCVCVREAADHQCGRTEQKASRRLPALTTSPSPPLNSWRPVDVDTTLVTGDGETGFAGLEELSGAEARALLATAGVPAAAPQAPPPSTDDLAARVAALEAENAALKAAADVGDAPPKKKKKKKVRVDAARGAATRGAPTPRDDTAADAAAPPPPHLTDGAPWRDLGLCAPLSTALAAAAFDAPTHIQSLALPPALRDQRDVVGAAPTGSGKTLAYGLAILERLVREGDVSGGGGGGEGAPPPPTPRLRALVLCPTRELALQVAAHLRPVASAIGARVAPVVGGVAVPKQARLLAARPHVVVATPGRLWDAMRSGDPHLADCTGLRCLALDEADRLAEAGAYAELASVLARVTGGGVDTARLQTFVFSATLTLPPALRRRLAKGGGGGGLGGASLDAVLAGVPLRGKPAVVDTAERGGGDNENGVKNAAAADATDAASTPPSFLADTVTELALEVAGGDARDAALYAAVVLATRGGGLRALGGAPAASTPSARRALVFVNAVSSARRLVALLRILGVPARALHAGTPQRARLKSLDAFAADPCGVLVATDVAARGLDVPGIAAVLHYQLPPAPDTYVHRCGRTGRAGKGGAALALVAPGDAARWRALRRAFGDPPAPPPPASLTPSVLASAGARVRAATVVDGAERAAAKTAAEAAWQARAAEEAGIDLDDADAPTATAAAADAAKQRAASDPGVRAARARLAAMLVTPLDGSGGGGGGWARATAAPAYKKAAAKKAGGDPRAAALAAAVAAASGGRKGRKRGRLVVVAGGAAVEE